MSRCRRCGTRRASAHGECPAPESATTSRLPPPPEIAGYRVEGLLGVGGFGAVFAAARERDGLPVAIKVAHGNVPVAAARLEREAGALRAIGAPFVPALLTTGTLHDRAPYLVMERLFDGNLARTLELQGPRPVRESLQIIDAVLAALEAAHAHGFVHRDLKPENVFVDGGRAKLIDFGLVHTPGAVSRLTADGTVVGSAEYMAPEQCDPRMTVDERADLYAVGILLFELLTGRTPFFGAPSAVLKDHLMTRPPRPGLFADVPPELERWILGCLSKRPADRPASAPVLRAGLRGSSLAAGARPTACAPAAPPLRAEKVMRPAIFALLRPGVPHARLVARIASLGAQLAHVSGARIALVFTGGAGDHPLRGALRAAEILCEAQLCHAACVDVVPTTLRTRPDGSTLFQSRAFLRDESYPPSTATGVALGPVAKDIDTRDRHPDRLVGREELLQTLCDHAGESVARSLPGLATVIAEPGQGRSALAVELARQLRIGHPDAEVIELTAPEVLDGESNVSLRALFAQLMEPASETALAALAAGENEGVLALAVALGLRPASDARVRRMGEAPGALHSGAVATAAGVLRRRAAQRPLMVLLDDAQFADPLLLDALEHATLAEASLPIWVCVLGRPAFRRTRASWGDGTASRLALTIPPLSSDEAAALCRRLLQPAEDVPDDAIAQLVERAHGSPLLLTELAGSLKRAGLVRRRARGDSFYLATDELARTRELPLLDWVAERELSSLSPELAAHAQLVSLLGASFLADEAEGVLRALDPGLAAAFPVDVQVGTARLIASELLTCGSSQVSFRNPLLRDAVARSVPQAMRTALHLAAHRHYRDAALPDEIRLPRLARHAEAAGLTEEAAAVSLELAERARARHAYLEAEQLYSRSLELLPPHEPRARMAALRGRATMRYRIGRYEDSVADFTEARTLAQLLADATAEVELLLDLATALDWTDQIHRSRELVEEAVELARRHGIDSLEPRLLMGRGRSAWRLARFGEAQALLERVVSSAASTNDSAYEDRVVALLILGHLLPVLGEIERAEEVFDEAQGLCESRGDKLHLAAVYINRMGLWLAKHDFASAIEDQERYIRCNRELGRFTSEQHGHYNIALILYQQGKLVEAEARLAEVFRIAERHPDDGQFGAAVQLLAGRVRLRAGNSAAARAIVAALRLEGRSLLPALEFQLRTLELATRPSLDDEWAALRRHAGELSLTEELADFDELRAFAQSAFPTNARATSNPSVRTTSA